MNDNYLNQDYKKQEK